MLVVCSAYLPLLVGFSVLYVALYISLILLTLLKDFPAIWHYFPPRCSRRRVPCEAAAYSAAIVLILPDLHLVYRWYPYSPG